jgi:hypothetical protein
VKDGRALSGRGADVHCGWRRRRVLAFQNEPRPLSVIKPPSFGDGSTRQSAFA